MAAGLGFKTFNTGDVLSAADTNGYLMQGIWVFANATARDAAVTSPQEGNSCYLKDTDVIQVYSGSSWVVKSGGSSPLTTKGDLYTYSTTDARLPVGANGTTLVADSSEATGLKWATASSGGMTLINSGGTTLTGSSVTISSIPATYQNLWLVIRSFKPSNDNEAIQIRLNGDSTANRYYVTASVNLSGTGFTDAQGQISPGNDNGTSNGLTTALIHDYANTVSWKMITSDSITNNATTSTQFDYRRYISVYNQTAAVSSITLLASGGTFTTGTAYLYGVS